MTTQNPYRRRSKIDSKKSLEILRYFCLDLTATTTGKIVGIERKTINNWYNYFREVVYWYSNREVKEVLNWVIEMDESYFWATRVKWKRWRWAGGKIKVFGLLKREWKVYTHIVDDVKASTLLRIIRWKVGLNSTLNTDKFRPYDGLVDLWNKKHYRVNHWENEFARGKQHINWIESFRSYCKRRLTKFNGVNKEKFALHLKECEFRFNCWLNKEDIYTKCKKILKEYVKKF